jgi:hypothetical protein
MSYHGGTITPTNTPLQENGHPVHSYRFGRDGAFIPLQEPDLLFGRNHLSGLFLQAAHNDSTDSSHKQHRRTLSAALNNPHMRYMRLIGDNNPRYRWEQYRKTPEELKGMKKPLFV